MTAQKKPNQKILQSIQKLVVAPIARSLNPEKIILFGSYAYGKPTKDSDLDILVILKQPKEHFKRYALVSRLLSPRPLPIDILVRTPGEVAKRLQIGDFFIQEIMERGFVLYDKKAA